MKLRPDTPKVFDITPDGYHEHNRYFNKAEKVFDKLEKCFYPEWMNGCGLCKDCGRTVHDFVAPTDLWIEAWGSEGGILCYDCFCERLSQKGLYSVFELKLQDDMKESYYHSSRRTAKND